MVGRQLAECQQIDPQRGAYRPQTPRGKTRYEMQNRGPLRPNKTYEDRMPRDKRPRVEAYQRRNGGTA